MGLAVPPELERYAREHTDPLHPLLEELERYTRERVALPQMLSGRTVGRLLHLLCLLSGARRVLEVGTYTGYASLCMALALPEDGRLVTVEKNEEFARVARTFFKRAPWGKKIELKLADARELLPKLGSGSFDFIFVDADKRSYPFYYEEGLRLLKKGGLMVFDNALWGGEVLNPKDERAAAVAEVNERARSDERTEALLLTVRDGLLVVKKVLE
ncbi:MAG: methyltransferase domain-containing protein [Aquificae bacterium]|nr:methyltransferase domain-containing protein [Aquificota bacterium]